MGAALPLGQLSTMLATLRDVFAESSNGLTIDAELARYFAGGLADMYRAALVLEQDVLTRREDLAAAIDIALVDDGGPIGPIRITRPQPAPAGVLVPFPRLHRPRPLPSGGDAA